MKHPCLCNICLKAKAEEMEKAAGLIEERLYDLGLEKERDLIVGSEIKKIVFEVLKGEKDEEKNMESTYNR